MRHLSSSNNRGTGRLPPDHTGADRVGVSAAAEPASCALLSSLPRSDPQSEIEIAGRRYVRQATLAGILGVSPRTLARWGARGFGPPKITIGKTVLFDVAKLPEWLAAREAAPTRNTRR
jgi:hypothetical protein